MSEEGLLDHLIRIARGKLLKKRFIKTFKSDLCSCLEAATSSEIENRKLLTNQAILARGLLVVRYHNYDNDSQLLSLLCRHMVQSMESADRECNFAAVFLNAQSISTAHSLCHNLYSMIPLTMATLNGERVSETRAWQQFIHWMIVFSSANTWQLVRNAPAAQQVLNTMCAKMSAPLAVIDNYRFLTKVVYDSVNGERLLLAPETFNALLTILARQLKNSLDLKHTFINYVLISPAVLLHASQPVRDMIVSSGLFAATLTYFNRSSGAAASRPADQLSLLANLAHLSYLDTQTMKSMIVEWTGVLGEAMNHCNEFREMGGASGGGASHHYWHPVFGQTNVRIDAKTEGSLKNVVRQLAYLWNRKVLATLFEGILPSNGKSNGMSASTSNSSMSTSAKDEMSNVFSKIWRKISSDKARAAERQVARQRQPLTLAALVCHLYRTALFTFDNVRSQILNGLATVDILLVQLWAFLKSWASKTCAWNEGVGLAQATLPILEIEKESVELSPLQLFVDAAASVINILDEEEMYAEGKPLPLEDLKAVARFANTFCFRAIWNGTVDASTVDDGLFASVHQLCSVLYVRDSRHRFTTSTTSEKKADKAVTGDKFWLASEVKPSVIISELERGVPRARLLVANMQHVLPLKQRVELFRKMVRGNKASLDTNVLTIRVVRARLVMDGFNQLGYLSSQQIRQTIRVRFVNLQGCDEAGIDQDGVFKEFLELTLKQVFDPSMQLFKSCNGLLYPSTCAVEKLDFYEHVGKMLAKAVYEGIVVDVQLAHVLLASVLGGRRLCAFDELAQLDPEMYRNLSFVKRYEGDVSELALTFSIDEEVDGRIVTTDLIPGGRTFQVDDDNKIDYVHRMAHHRVFRQSARQCAAFVRGMQAVLEPRWLQLFAPHELHVLIAGTSSDVDIADLRAHVQYYGGFHGGHRVVKWLWQILENDFTAEERSLFLKFVTSCSRGPLLGFSHLEPPFSIRCVEPDHDDDVDTVGTVIRGFLSFRKTGDQPGVRLPTASTCFNLLKLPNYSKKSTLLAKLRYAIHAHAGFELS